MKLRNTIIILATLLLSTTVSAQKTDITSSTIEKVGDNVIIHFNLNIEKLPTNSMLTLTPVIWKDNKRDSLAPVKVIGRNKAITMERRGEKVESANLISNLTALSKYKAIIPFEQWMVGATLSLGNTVERCYSKKMFDTMIIDSNILQTTEIKKPVMAKLTIQPTPIFGSDVKAAYLNDFQETINGSGFISFIGNSKDLKSNDTALPIYFKEGSNTVDTSYMNDYRSISKMQDAISLIKSNPIIRVSKIYITGSSSPKGNYTQNKKISHNRIKSLMNYFNQDIAYDEFKVVNIGENWDELYALIKSSNMDYKDEVLEIIDDNPIHIIRKSKLKSLADGAPYKYIVSEFFPMLRKASYTQIFYKISPNDQLDEIDEASKLIKSKDYKKALDKLQKVTPTSYTDNLIGVCYMMTNDTDNAKLHFQKAIDGGNRDAQSNLIQMNL